MIRHVRFYTALVLIAAWFTLAMLSALPAHAACGQLASWYGFESGNRTANGERFDPWGLTAAHRSLPFGTIVRVTYAGRSVTVRINDRGPASWTGREIDLSMAAFAELAPLGQGVISVCLDVQ